MVQAEAERPPVLCRYQPGGDRSARVKSCQPDNIEYVPNTDYWQSKPGHPVPSIAQVDYPAFLSNAPANLFLLQGQAQWGSQYIPSIQSFYITKVRNGTTTSRRS